MPTLIAKRSMRYAGRALKAGDSFEANARDSRALVAVGRADLAPAEPERDGLRREAEALGIEVDGRWGAQRLQDAISAARRAPRTPEQEQPPEEAEGEPPAPSVPRFYRRRDMVAEEE